MSNLSMKWSLEPREGIGGHCLPKDTKMFLNSSKSIKSKIIEAVVKTDETYRMHRQTMETNQKKDSITPLPEICHNVIF
jgi:UDP-N-acetyl-D-mannosaminuronic acid dehydrogenase